MSGSKYSFSLTTFSPSGELVQIKHALAAISSGATSLGIKARDGVVLATEKKLPSALVDASTVKKIVTLTDDIGVTYSGMGTLVRAKEINEEMKVAAANAIACLLYTSPSPRDLSTSRMPSSA